ncbi:glutamate-5-semialdehyde dehydrogenase, partial [Candidatus Peregrinibacteria bacterium]|nr:glutamate-5-semialdehyde dehydrogenase [Candidatus Peregrinibacteria bacterium]
MINVRFLAAKAYEASKKFALFSSVMKNEILEKIACAIEENLPVILKANRIDVDIALKKKMPSGLVDRLILNKERLQNIISEIRKVEALGDPVGKIIESRELKNGLFLKRVRVPLGVIGIIYEARPNVTVDSVILCLKSGNAVILKGGSDSINTNRALIKLIKNALDGMQDAVQFIDLADHAAVQELLKLNGLIDVIIPRGGKKLINFVRENSTVPVIETGASVVHTYIHEDADIAKAVKIILNAKLRRVSICNALDVLVLHKNIAEDFLNAFIKALPKNPYKADKLEIHACDSSFNILRSMKKPKKFDLSLKKAKEIDYDTEFLDYILAIKIVRNFDSALEHIAHH